MEGKNTYCFPLGKLITLKENKKDYPTNCYHIWSETYDSDLEDIYQVQDEISLKILNRLKENFAEIQQITQDAFEDGLLMEVSESQMRDALHQLVDQLINPYQKQ